MILLLDGLIFLDLVINTGLLVWTDSVGVDPTAPEAEDGRHQGATNAGRIVVGGKGKYERSVFFSLLWPRARNRVASRLFFLLISAFTPVYAFLLPNSPLQNVGTGSHYAHRVYGSPTPSCDCY